MRDQWYGDSRDLIKWGVLIRLARAHRLPAILQVAMLSRSAPYSSIETSDGDEWSIDANVIKHFRNVHSILPLAAACGLEITVHSEEFPIGAIEKTATRRHAYFETLYRKIAVDPRPLLVFLDPDTGLAPKNADHRHVTAAEVAALFASLKEGDLLVLYQHGRRERDWFSAVCEEFAIATGTDKSRVWTARPISARDLAFFAVARRP